MKSDYTMMGLIVMLACVCGVAELKYAIGVFALACGLVILWNIQDYRRATWT